MGFVEAIQTCLKKYATFSGRARRREFWFWSLLNGAILCLLYVIILCQMFGKLVDMPVEQLDAMSDFEVTKMMFSTSPVVLILSLVYLLAAFLPSLAVSVRRFHDIGKSGWWYFISLVPYVGGLIYFVFMCMDSQPGENMYGPNPKENPEPKDDDSDATFSSSSSKPFGEA